MLRKCAINVLLPLHYQLLSQTARSEEVKTNSILQLIHLF